MTDMSEQFTKTPKPPYYAVIFSSRLRQSDEDYDTMGNAMAELALSQPGCLGAESCRDGSLFGITVSYWQDEASLIAWNAMPSIWSPNGLVSKNGTSIMNYGWPR